MYTKDIFELALKLGTQADPRTAKGVAKRLEHIHKTYEELTPKEKAKFDQLKLTNPYLDSAIHFDTGKPVKKILVGIDISGAELLLAQQLEVDLVISHHPEGAALAHLDDVMHLQADLLHSTAGVPINIAEGILRKRIAKLKRQLAPINHYQNVDLAKLIDISFVSIHTPTDNLVWYYLEQAINQKKPQYVGELIELLEQIPEYQEGAKRGAGPMLFSGEKDGRCGKIACTEITGGTSNDKDIYQKMAQAGLGTIVAMHIAEDSREEAERHHLNVIVAGHIASDSLGMNIFLDQLEMQTVEIIPCSGLIRIKRSSE